MLRNFSAPEIRAETCFGDDHIGELKRRLGRDHGIAAMRDIGERAALDERGRAFQRLHEVWLQGVLQQRRHPAGAVQRSHADQAPSPILPDDHIGEPRRKIAHVFCETERRHDLRSGRNVEPVFAHDAVAVEADDEIAKGAVVHIDSAPPAYFARVEAKRIAPIHVIVDQRRQEIMR